MIMLENKFGRPYNLGDYHWICVDTQIEDNYYDFNDKIEDGIYETYDYIPASSYEYLNVDEEYVMGEVIKRFDMHGDVYYNACICSNSRYRSKVIKYLGNKFNSLEIAKQFVENWFRENI